MKPEHFCINHPALEAVSFCHHCHTWVCPSCLTEGPEHYYCHKAGCLKALESEEVLITKKCPRCGEIITADIPSCGSCGKKLRNLTTEEKAEKLITIAKYKTSIEAHLARTKLESEGIESYVNHEHLGPPYSFLVFGGVPLQIKKSDANQAYLILDIKEVVNSPIGTNELFAIQEKTIGDSSTDLSKTEIVKCPHCGVENEMKAGIKFCGECGKRLNSAGRI
jgi:hypothetical protein